MCGSAKSFSLCVCVILWIITSFDFSSVTKSRPCVQYSFMIKLVLNVSREKKVKLTN